MKKHLLICCHNGALFVEEQLESIIQQDSRIDFYHVFDFSSNDGTPEVITNLFKRYGLENFTVHRYRDAPGASRSFFTAFDELSKVVEDEDCIFLADQDDVWLPGKVRAMQDVFERKISKNKNLAVFHSVKVVDSDLKVIKEDFYTGNPYSVPRDLSIDRLLLCNPVIGHTLLVSGAALKMVSREMNHAGYIMHDWALMLWLRRFGEVDFLLEKPLSLYRQHANNILGTTKKRSLKDSLYRANELARAIVLQVTEFSSDLRKKPEVLNIYFLDKILIYINEKKYRKILIYPFLAFLAFFRGPTFERKMLALFFFWQLFSRKK